MSKDWQSQSHVRWDCKFHVVIVPKYRKKLLYGKVRRKVGEILRDLCRQLDHVSLLNRDVLRERCNVLQCGEVGLSAAYVGV